MPWQQNQQHGVEALAVSETTAVPQLAVVVISHGHEAYLSRCLDSIPAALDGLSAQVLLVDNLGSSAMAGIVGRSPVPVTLRVNATPKGFAGNCNAAIRSTRAPYVLLLNPDTAFVSGRVKEAVDFMEANRGVGILGCRLLNRDGRQQESYRRYPIVPVFLARVFGAERWPWRPAFYRSSLMQDQGFTGPGEVDLVTGACFLLRRRCFDQIGGFDEGFFMYWEDADFCYRARVHGFSTFFYPGITVFHELLRSSRVVTSRHAMWHLRSAVRFFRKHRVVFRAPAPQNG
jgi:N-acetylglucosaminyl-diphospho-decaprenol L-rhamnosyltransferase